MYYIPLKKEYCKSKLRNGGDSDGGNGDGGDGDGGDGNGGGGDDWTTGVDRMHAVWEIFFIL